MEKPGKKYARIRNGLVVQVDLITDPPDYGMSNVQTVELDDVIPEPGDIFNGTSFSKPVITQAQLDAQTNAAADKDIAAMIPDAVFMLMNWAQGQATGPNKATLKTLLDKFNAEKAKKK